MKLSKLYQMMLCSLALALLSACNGQQIGSSADVRTDVNTSMLSGAVNAEGPGFSGSMANVAVSPLDGENFSKENGSVNYTFTMYNADNLGLLANKLTLAYNSSTKSWDMSIPKVIISSNPKILTNNGAQYIIDSYSPTGLKYITDKSLHFDSWGSGKRVSEVCSNYTGSSSYFYSYKTPDSRLYFDQNGYLMAAGDKNNNCNLYSYDISGRLTQVKDVFGHAFTFNKGSTELVVSSPEGVIARIHYLNNKDVDLITDAMGKEVRFKYFNGLLSSIQYPSGVRTNITYKNILFTDGGVDKSISVVGNVKHVAVNGNIINNTDYYYGEGTSNHNFTGYGVYAVDHGSDTMMEQNISSYQYDVKVVNRSSEGDRITQTYFNFLHLPIKEIKSSGGIKYEIISKYDTEYNWNKIRKAYYSQPISVTTTLGERVVKRIVNTYDSDYGILLTAKIYGLKDVLQSSQENIADDAFPWLLKSTVLKDGITGQIKKQEMSYDARGNLAQQTDSYNNQSITHTYSYLSNGLPSATTFSDGKTSATSKYSYATNDNTMSVTSTDPVGRFQTTTYSTIKMFNPVLSVVNSDGSKEEYTVDMKSRATSITNALGQVTKYSYSQTANTMTAPSGYQVTETLDELNRVIAVSDNKNGGRKLVSTVYNTFGEVASKTDNLLNLTTSYEYDTWGRQIKSTAADGNVTSIVYDDSNDTVTTFLNGMKVNEVLMDPDGNKLEETSFSHTGKNSKKVKNSYNGFGQLIANTDYLDGVEYGKSSYSYDLNNKVVNSTFNGFDGTSSKINNSYDMYGNLLSASTSVTSQGKTSTHNSVVNSYNLAGNLISSKDQLGRITRYIYDNLGRVIQVNGGDGSVTKTTYDKLGQVLSETTSNMYGSTTVTFTYDVSGNVITKTRDGKVYTYNYDKLQTLLNSITYPDGVIYNYSYTKADQVSSLTGKGVDKSYTYGSLGDIQSLSNQGHTLNFNYGNANGVNHVLLSQSLKSNLKEIYTKTFSYDGWMHPQNIAIKHGGKTLATANNFNSLSQLVSTTTTNDDSSVTISYKYDTLGRLLEVQNSIAKPEQYNYDANGNVISYTDDKGVTHSLNYNGIDQLIYYDNTPISYDQLGNSKNGLSGMQYQFDVNNNLIEVDTGSQFISYTYSADNLLATRTVKDKFGLSNGTVYTFYYGPDNQLAVIKNGQDEYNVLDSKDGFIATNNLLSSVYPLANNKHTDLYINGDEQLLTKLLSYNGYGVGLFKTEGNLLISFNYNKQYTDEATGLVYMHARWYDPKRMSFINRDSYKLENRYNYANGDPINYADPSGHKGTPNWLNYVIGSVVVVAAAIATATSLGTAAHATIALMASSTIFFAGGLGTEVAADNVDDKGTKQALNWSSVGLNAAGVVTGIGAGMVNGVSSTVATSAENSVHSASSIVAEEEGNLSSVSSSVFNENRKSQELIDIIEDVDYSNIVKGDKTFGSIGSEEAKAIERINGANYRLNNEAKNLNLAGYDFNNVTYRDRIGVVVNDPKAPIAVVTNGSGQQFAFSNVINSEGRLTGVAQMSAFATNNELSQQSFNARVIEYRLRPNLWNF